MKRKTWLRKKLGRKRSILKAINKKKLGRFHRKCKQRRLWKIGAWNVRRWGAPNVPYDPWDPWSKTRCIFRLATMARANVGRCLTAGYELHQFDS